MNTIDQLIREVASQPENDRRAKVRTVVSLRRQLDHALMLQSLGQPVDAAQVDRMNDQLSELARTEPFLSLAEVS